MHAKDSVLRGRGLEDGLRMIDETTLDLRAWKIVYDSLAHAAKQLRPTLIGKERPPTEGAI